MQYSQKSQLLDIIKITLVCRITIIEISFKNLKSTCNQLIIILHGKNNIHQMHSNLSLKTIAVFLIDVGKD